jgi:hypothetical protein
MARMKYVAAAIAFLLTAWLGWHAIEFRDDWVLTIYVLVASAAVAWIVTRWEQLTDRKPPASS